MVSLVGGMIFARLLPPDIFVWGLHDVGLSAFVQLLDLTLKVFFGDTLTVLCCVPTTVFELFCIPFCRQPFVVGIEFMLKCFFSPHVSC